MASKEEIVVDRRSFLTLALGAALTPVTLAACGKAKRSADEWTERAQEQKQEQVDNVANPFVDCMSAADAAQLAGFDVTFPEAVPGYPTRMYQAIKGELAQCIYAEGNTSVLIRKGIDDGTGDISGDYNEYQQVASVQVGDVEVTERGNNNVVYVATWSKNGYLFAIDAEQGLDAETIESLVSQTQ